MAWTGSLWGSILISVLCVSSVQGGTYKLWIKTGSVKDSDNWPTGDSDPYVNVDVNGIHWYTGYISDDNTPAWNVFKDFGDVPDTSRVKFDVYDYDEFLTFGSDKLGSTDFSVTKTGERNEGCCGGHIKVYSEWYPVNLCNSNNGGCGDHATCVYTGDKKRSCNCHFGYQMRSGSCTRIYACQATTNGGCGLNTKCVDTGPGTRRCDCNSGYERASNGVDCSSINPCLSNNGGCGSNSFCSHVGPNVASCTCDSNYYGNTEGKNCKRVTTCSGGTYESTAPTKTNNRVCTSCSAGYQCAGGTSQPTECGASNKYAGGGRATCLSVSTGYTTTGGTTTTRTGQKVCPKGHSCVLGVKFPCGNNFYQDEERQTKCKPCTANCPSGYAKTDCTKESDIVCSDVTKPVLQLIGGLSITVEAVLGTYVEQGVLAIDAIDGDLSSRVTISGLVDTNQLGTYTLTYTVKDNSKNEISKTRTVNVVDTTPPNIDLGNFAVVEVEAGTALDLPTIKAHDAVDGDVTDQISVSGLDALQGFVDAAVLRDVDLTYEVTDSSNNKATAIQKVKIVDTLIPVISLLGDRLLHVEATPEPQSWTDPGFSAHDFASGDITSLVVVSGDDVDSSTPGEYHIYYDVEDGGQKARTVSRVVTVSDTSPPTIFLLGDDPIFVEAKSTWIDPGYDAYDTFDGPLLANATSPNMDTLGTYNIDYETENEAGLKARVTRQVVVVDTTKPSLTLLGPTELSLEAAIDTFSETGFAAADTVDGDLTNAVTVDVAVDFYTPGSYHITYSVADHSGNVRNATRNVTIVDTTGPTITLQGDVVTYHEAATTFNDPGFGASDLVDGGVPVYVNGTVDLFPLVTPSSFVLYYTAEDNTGNRAQTKSRTVIIVDTTPPTVTFSVPHVYLEGATAFIPPEVLASDSLDGEIEFQTAIFQSKASNGSTSNVSVEAVNIFSPANSIYYFHYTSSDAAGNQADEVIQTLEIVDTTPPKLHIFGDVTIEAHRPLKAVQPDSFALDSLEGFVDPIYAVKLLNTTATNLTLPTLGGFDIIDTRLPLGTTWMVNYTATDSSGNTQVVSQIKTLVDSTPPTVTVNPLSIGRGSLRRKRDVTQEEEWFIPIDSTYVEPGASAWDDYDGDMSAMITINGTVDTSTEGAYPISYEVTDNSGNHQVVLRDIYVVAPQRADEVADGSTAEKGGSSDDNTIIIIACVCGVLACLAALVVFFVVRNRRGKSIEKEVTKPTSGEGENSFMYSNPSYTAPDGTAYGMASEWESNNAYGLEESKMDTYSIPMASGKGNEYDQLIRFDDQAAVADGWFHGSIDEDTAAKLVAKEGDGAFLVRYGSSTGRDFYITTLYDKVVAHHSLRLGKCCTIDDTPIPATETMNVADVLRWLRSKDQTILPAPLKTHIPRPIDTPRTRDNPLYFHNHDMGTGVPQYAQYFDSLDKLDKGRPVYAAVQEFGKVVYAEVDGPQALEIGCPVYVNLRETAYSGKPEPSMAKPVGFDDDTMLPITYTNRTSMYGEVVVGKPRGPLNNPTYEVVSPGKPRDSGYIQLGTGEKYDKASDSATTYAIPTSSGSDAYVRNNAYMDVNPLMMQTNVAYAIPDEDSSKIVYDVSA